MKCTTIWLGLALAVFAFGCDDDDGDPSVEVTAEEDDDTSTPAGSCPAGPPSEGSSCDISGNIACTYGDEVCNCIGFMEPSWQCREDEDTPDDPPFGGEGGAPSDPFGDQDDDAQDDDPNDFDDDFGDSDDDEPAPTETDNAPDCPGDAPSDGEECNISFLSRCTYDGVTCSCQGSSWSCPTEDGEPEPTFEPDGGADEPVPADEAGVPEPPDPELADPDNPETCPDESPPSDVCDIDAVGFGTECRYGLRTCTCGGFPGDGEWACVMEEPPVVNPETCPEAAPPDDVCEIEEVGFGTTCVYDDLSCVCGGFPGAGEWQCSGEGDPPEAADASAPVPSGSDAG